MESKFSFLSKNLKNVFQLNFKNLKAIEWIKNNYQIPSEDFDFDLHPFITNLNQTIMSWIVDSEVDLEEFESLLVYTFNKKPKVVQYIRSLGSFENFRLMDLIQIVSESKDLEKNSLIKSKVDMLLAFLISPPEKSDTIFSI